jgi:hypothetical protein
MKADNLLEAQAMYLAEAGMEYALYLCRPANGGCVDNATYSVDGTTVPIDVTPLGGVNYTIQTSVDYANI